MTRYLPPQVPECLPFYLTEEHPCAYLADCQARTLFLDPSVPMGDSLYQQLIARGFRRSGRYVYRPACRACTGCIPVRIPTMGFKPNRSQRRIWRRNAQDIAIKIGPARFEPAHFALYQRYLTARHPEGEMAKVLSADHYRRFLVDPWGGTTCLIELWLGDRLVGVAVTDVVQHGLSAVYTYFAPDLAARSLGTFAILTQIQIAQQSHRPFLYLGYWIDSSPKMAYKDRFRPIEAWDGHHWRRFMRDQPIALAQPVPQPGQ